MTNLVTPSKSFPEKCGGMGALAPYVYTTRGNSGVSEDFSCPLEWGRLGGSAPKFDHFSHFCGQITCPRWLFYPAIPLSREAQPSAPSSTAACGKPNPRRRPYAR
jgi:hypothetical protein